MGTQGAPPSSQPLTERGETLIEVLVTIVIVATAAAALIGALVTSASSSGEHRTLAQEEVALKSYADSAKQQIELVPPSPSGQQPLYQTCAAIADYNTLTPPPVPPGITVDLTSIDYWGGSSFTPKCNERNVVDMQEITLTATAAGGERQTLTFIVRNPGAGGTGRR